MSAPLLPIGPIALVALLVAGCFLFIYGLRGRRIGNEPRCRKCAYNLTGLTSGQCPECGSTTSGENVVIGTSRRRWRVLIAGLVLLSMSSTWFGVEVYRKAKVANWYAYLPTFVVIQRARADVPPAIAELARRYRTRTVGHEPVVELIPVALARQAAKPRTPVASRWTDFLAAAEAAGVLTEAQRERFFDQIVSVSIEFRPKVRQGERFSFSVRKRVVGSVYLDRGIHCWIRDATLRIGEWKKEFGDVGGGILSMRGLSSGTSGYFVPTDQLQPGTYAAEFEVTKTFVRGADPNATEPFLSIDVRLGGELSILPSDAPDSVRLVDDPALAEGFRQAIVISAADRWRGGRPKPGMVYADIAVVRSPPMDGAFQVIALVGEREIDAGTFTVKKAGRKGPAFSRRLGPIRAESFVPILRTSLEAARETPDIFKIWDGELRFEAVELPKPPASQKSQVPPNG